MQVDSKSKLANDGGRGRFARSALRVGTPAATKSLLVACLALETALFAGCRGGGISPTSSSLAVSCPSDPGALSSQGQNVTVDFGNVPVGQTATLPLELTSLSGSGIIIDTVQPQQSASNFTFPLSPNTTVAASPPTLVQATFAPVQAGSRTSSWKLSLASGASLLLTLTGNGFPVALTVSPNPVDFGNVELRTTAPLSVTVTNGSSQAVDLSLSPPANAPFAVGPLPISHLASNASLTLPASYSPLQAKTDSATFTLSGCSGCASGTVQIPLQGVGVVSTLSYPNPFLFGFVSPRTSLQKILALKNIGNSALRITSQPTLYPGALAPPPGQPPVYAFASDTTLASFYTLDAGAELDLPIVFTPPQIGAYVDATLTFTTSDAANPQVTISLRGYGGGAQISCQPQSLNLGPVALGFVNSRPLLCFNAGTDVPGHPEAALQLSQSQLSIDNLAFVAQLLGDSDAGSPDGGLSLAAGRSALIAVSFRPGDAGVESGTLQVGSNDVAHSPLAVPLTGRGVVPGPCTDTLLPSGGLDFGEVPQGNSAILEFAVQNQSDNYCILQDIALAPGSDPAFSLPIGPIAYQLLSFPGDPNNGSGLPTEYRVPVQFAPTQMETTASGNVSLQVSNGNPVSQLMAVAGSSAPACLTFAPSRLDFGLVGFDPATQSLCTSPQQSVTVENSCASSVTVTSIVLQNVFDPSPQFSLQNLPTLPTSLSPGAQLRFQVTFAATQPGPQLEALQVRSSEFATPYTLSLSGDAEATGTRTDSFLVQQKQLDLLLVLDDDDDHDSTAATAFPAQLPQLLTEAAEAQLDYRIAVTTTAPCSDKGSFEPCDNCQLKLGSNPVYITPQSQPDPADALTQLVSAIWNKGNSDYTCVEHSTAYSELLFPVIQQAFAPALLAGHNSGFLRDGAYLSIITVNGDGEDDETNLSVPSVANFLWSLKPQNPALVTWSCVNEEVAGRVSQLASATGGLLIDLSATGWQSLLLQLLSQTIQLGTYPLGAEPNPATLQVEVNGSPLPQIGSASSNANWSYDPTRNAIVLDPSAIPAPGSSITITYAITCS